MKGKILGLEHHAHDQDPDDEEEDLQGARKLLGAMLVPPKPKLVNKI